MFKTGDLVVKPLPHGAFCFGCVLAQYWDLDGKMWYICQAPTREFFFGDNSSLKAPNTCHSDFCRHCGAGIPPKVGEGTCLICDPIGVLKNGAGTPVAGHSE